MRWQRGPTSAAWRERVCRRALAALLWVGTLCVVAGALLVSCQPGFERGPAVLEAMLFPTPPLVRVALTVGSAAGEVAVSADGHYEVSDLATGQRLSGGSRLPPASLAASGEGLRLGQRTFARPSLRLWSPNQSPLRLNGASYQGDLLCFQDGGTVTVVNELDVENYVAGVLAAEMPLHFEDEALKAQTVASRTYVLYEAKTGRSPFYDVLPTEASQVYKGLTVATARARRMVKATRGIILAVGGRTFPAYFHSTCGGHTTEVGSAWPSVHVEPLRGVPCGYCQDSPAYSWEVGVPGTQLNRALAEQELFSGPVTAITVTGRASSGYATRLLVAGPSGRRHVDAYQFRLALGGHELPSTNFVVVRTATGFLFRGRGFGHGVGLCQWGAEGQARAGRNYREILTHYYPGSQLTRIYP